MQRQRGKIRNKKRASIGKLLMSKRFIFIPLKFKLEKHFQESEDKVAIYFIYPLSKKWE